MSHIAEYVFFLRFSFLRDVLVPGKIDGTRMGLVRLEHEYPYGVGDIDHGSTFRFKSCPGVVQGLTFEEAQRGSQDPVILENLKCVLDKMEAEECFGIAGNCGFMHFYQEFVRDYATVPVFMSALVQVPTMAAALEPDERIHHVHHALCSHLLNLGISLATIRHLAGMSSLGDAKVDENLVILLVGLMVLTTGYSGHVPLDYVDLCGCGFVYLGCNPENKNPIRSRTCSVTKKKNCSWYL